MHPALQLVLLLALSYVVARAGRAAMRRSTSAGASAAARNIGAPGRTLRLLFGAGLLVLGILLWQPLLILFAGVTLYEAVAGWCWLNALVGRNSCSVR